MSEYHLYFDGCSKGNPGISGIGVVLYKDGDVSWELSKFIGKATNNVSEYTALINGLEYALSQNILNLDVFGDSMIVINQMKGIYKVKSENLTELYNRALTLSKQFEEITFKHVYRDKNKIADKLANQSLTQQSCI
jgi:ribonuclease HI